MATAKEFIERIGRIEGVAGCLLIKQDGALLGRTLDDPETFTILMQIGTALARDIMEKTGFSHCRHVTFSRAKRNDFYVFPIDNYLLGVVIQPEASTVTLLEAINRLIGRVSTGRS